VLKNGRTLTRTVDNFLGSYQRPMSDEQMAVKYRRLAEKTLSPERTRELERLVRNLAAAPSAASVIDLLRGAPSSGAAA
jgi:2-methylcitrate dehydratase PrpD